MTNNPYLNQPQTPPPFEPPKPKHTGRNVALALLAGVVVIIVVVVAVAVSQGTTPKAAPPAAAPPTSSAPAVLKVPTVYAMTADKATATLAQAGFTGTPEFGYADNTPLTDPTGYTVSGVIDTTSAITSPQADDIFVLTMKPDKPCASDPNYSADDFICLAVEAPVSTEPAVSGKVVYKVSGDHHGMITYTDGSAGAIEQETDASLPWSKTVDDGDFNYVSAQNSGGGSISCSITRDGEVVSTHSSSGSYAIVTCSP